MKEIEIEYKISDTEKEIYGFTRSGNNYYYSSFFYSNRDDKNDAWGENWGKVNEKAEQAELDEFARSKGFKDYDELYDSIEYVQESYYWEGINEIENKYNPVGNKTKHGKYRYGGCSWGAGDRKGKYEPKMKKVEIELAILKKIRKIKVKL